MVNHEEGHDEDLNIDGVRYKKLRIDARDKSNNWMLVVALMLNIVLVFVLFNFIKEGNLIDNLGVLTDISPSSLINKD